MLSRSSHRLAFSRFGCSRFQSNAAKEKGASLNSVPSAPTNSSAKGLLSRFLARHSLKKQSDRILVAESFLQAATRQAADPRWYGAGRLSRDFRTHQSLCTAHVWLVHKRLISDIEDSDTASLIQEEFFDAFWNDATNRMRAHGVNELSITKNLKAVQQYSFMHCFHYDHCYTELLDNPKERLEELKNLVMTHILLINSDDHKAQEDADDQAERIAWYIETQYQNIVHDLPEDLFRKARIAWVDLPDFSDLKDASGKTLEVMDSHDDDILPVNWVRNIANDGSYFYWNTETRESQWERPN